jgi:hypothetical protein
MQYIHTNPTLPGLLMLSVDDRMGAYRPLAAFELRLPSLFPW